MTIIFNLFANLFFLVFEPINPMNLNELYIKISFIILKSKS